jgi:hypothetical protein
MSKVSYKNGLNDKLSDIVKMSVLKRKFKEYLTENDDEDDYKNKVISSVYPKFLVITLVMVMEELLSDCLEYVKKHDVTGLYVIDLNMVNMVMNKNSKYDFSFKYVRKYNSSVKYNDGVFFDFKKVLDNLESKYGDKLMVNNEARNFLAYLLLSLQYELLNLSLTILEYADKKMLSSKILLVSFKLVFPDLFSKVKLKVDSINQIKKNNEEDEEAEEGDDSDDSEDESEEEKVNQADKENNATEDTKETEVTKSSNDKPTDEKPSGKKVIKTDSKQENPDSNTTNPDSKQKNSDSKQKKSDKHEVKSDKHEVKTVKHEVKKDVKIEDKKSKDTSLVKQEKTK